MALGLIVAVLRYIPSAICVWAAKTLVFLFAPLLALPCFVRIADEGVLTLDPRKYGRHHEFLVPWLMWAQTHDAPLDEWWFGGYGEGGRLKSKFSQADYERSALLRWAARVLWLWRNPAYGVAQELGYDQVGMKTLFSRDEGAKWDSGLPNFSYRVVKNAREQYGFMVEWQWYFYKQRCIEVYIGWKLHREDPDRVCMLTARVSPFKQYALKQAATSA